MPTTTPRIGLTKPLGSEAAQISVLNANADKIDEAISTRVCTSTTRPGTPYTGQLIYETDTDNVMIYEGSWKVVGGQPTIKLMMNAASQSAANGTWAGITFDLVWELNNTDFYSFASGFITLLRAGTYRIDAKVIFDANATGQRMIQLVKTGATGGWDADIQPAMTGGEKNILHLSTVVAASANDQWSIQAYQNSGGALNILQGVYVQWYGVSNIIITKIG